MVGEVEPTWRLAFSNPWPAVVTVLVVAAGIMLFAWLYRREGQGISVATKVVLATLRAAVFLLVLFVLLGPVLVAEQADRRSDHVCILLDHSLSMGLSDTFDDQKEAATAYLQAAGVAVPTAESEEELAKKLTDTLAQVKRLDVLKKQLTANQGQLLRDLLLHHRVLIYGFADGKPQMLSRLNTVDDVPAAIEEIAKLTPRGPETRMGDAIRHMLNELAGQQISGMIYLGDGQNNAGYVRPDQATVDLQSRGVRTFAVGLGNPTRSRDVVLRQMFVDDEVTLSDRVKVDVEIVGYGYRGTSVTVQLTEIDDQQKRRVVASKNVMLPGKDGELVPVKLEYIPGQKGKVKIVAEVLPAEGEKLTENNRRSDFLEVTDKPVRVLFVDGYARYEYRYLKNLLLRDRRVDVSCYLQEADALYPQEGDKPILLFPTQREELDEYDVIIFGDVDPNRFARDTDGNHVQLQMVADFVREGGGFVMVAGERFAPKAYVGTPIADLLPVEIREMSTAGIQGKQDKPAKLMLTPQGRESAVFQFDADPIESARIYGKLPGFYWFSAVTKAKSAARVLAVHPYVKGVDDKNLPVVVTQFVGSGRTMFNGVDSLWRWRWRNGDKYLATFWLQTINFLKPPKVSLNVKPDYALAEPVRILLRFRSKDNKEQILSQGGEVAVFIESEMQGKKKIVLKSTSDDTMEATFVPPSAGKYKITSSVAAAVSETPLSAEFEVQPQQAEFKNAWLDDATLADMANATRGASYSAVPNPEIGSKPLSQVPHLHGLIPPTETEVVSKATRRLWDSPWVLALFMLLLVIEWLLRKRARMI